MKPSYLFAKIFITGGIVLALELAASRILTPFFGVSLYVWAAILSVTLIALAIGYSGGGMLSRRLDKQQALLLYGAAGGLAALWINLCAWTYPFLFWPLSNASLVGGSILACLYLLFVPLVILSALNPLLVSLLEGGDKKGDAGAGKVFFVSTTGSVAGVFVAAFGMMPYLTNYVTVVILAAAAAGLSLAFLWQINDKTRNFRLALTASVFALGLALLTLFTGGLEKINTTMIYNDFEWRIVHTRPSYFGQIQVVDIVTKSGVVRRNLFNDGLVQNQFAGNGESTTLYTYALEELALAAADDPRKALVLGTGAGVIPEAFARAGMDVHSVDISPEMIEVSREFLGFDPEGISISIEDARMAARRCADDYDIVAVDLFRGDGIPEHLSTYEFFSDIHACLKPGGVMVMNSFMNVQDPVAEYALVKTIGAVFGEVALIARPPKHDPDMTVAFIVARRGGPVGDLQPDLSGMPPLMSGQLADAMSGMRLVRPDDPDMQEYPVLTDISNQWKRLAYSSELAYRRSVATQLPWRILMN